MKKSLIAGASIAALGLAVVPFAGVFAKDGDITSMTDSFTVTVNPTCSFNTGSHAYDATIEVNSKLTESKSTAMNVKCNNTKGYQVTVTKTEDLDLADKTGTTTGNDSIPFTTAAVAAGTAGWNAYKTETVDSTTTTTYFAVKDAATSAGVSNIVMESDQMTPTEGDNVTINYDIATSKNQAQGSYTGSITYTLTAKTASATE